MEDKLLTLDEVVKYLEISKSTLYKLSQKKKLPSCKIGKQLRFRKSSLDKWLTEKEGSCASHAPEQRPKCVLLIEDDKLVLRAITRLLISHGYEVEPVESGEEALKKAKDEDFDLLITDMRMPGIDGIETIKRIRQMRQALNRPKVPEIIITGYTDGRPEAEAEKLGIRDYLYKPFATADFIKTIENKLEFIN